MKSVLGSDCYKGPPRQFRYQTTEHSKGLNVLNVFGLYVVPHRHTYLISNFI